MKTIMTLALLLLPLSQRAEGEWHPGYFSLGPCDVEGDEGLCAQFTGFATGTGVTLFEEGGNGMAAAEVTGKVKIETSVMSYSGSRLKLSNPGQGKMTFAEGVAGEVKDFKRVGMRAVALSMKAQVALTRLARGFFKESFLKDLPDTLKPCLTKLPKIEAWALDGLAGTLIASCHCDQVNVPLLWKGGKATALIEEGSSGEILGALRLDGKVYLRLRVGSPGTDNVGTFLRALD